MSAGNLFALADSPGHLSPAAAQTLNLTDMDVTAPLSLVGIAILFLCFGLAIVNSALLPGWLGWVCFPFALVALIPTIGFVAFIAAGLWALAVSIAMWLRVVGAETAPTSSAT